MAVEIRPISQKQFIKMTRPMLGLRVTRPWLGYGNAFFAEFGTLHTETITLRDKTRRFKKGQASVMMDSQWRAELGKQIAFGCEDSERALERGLKILKGRKIVDVYTEGVIPEVVIVLNGGWRIHSFCNSECACWTLFLRDPKLFPRAKRWNNFDHELCITFENQRLEQHMCYGPLKKSCDD
jgi:hypothetical protein